MLRKIVAVEEASSIKRTLMPDRIKAAAIGLVLIAHGFEQLNPFVETNTCAHFAGVPGRTLLNYKLLLFLSFVRAVMLFNRMSSTGAVLFSSQNIFSLQSDLSAYINFK